MSKLLSIRAYRVLLCLEYILGLGLVLRVAYQVDSASAFVAVLFLSALVYADVWQ